MKYALGFDFGTSGARACFINAETGEPIASAAFGFEGGDGGIYVDSNRPLLARQSPLSYLESMEKAGKSALEEFVEKGHDPQNIIGIGVDATGSTPIPVRKNMQPLMAEEQFKDNLNAYAWLWKDHTAVKEAVAITEKAAADFPEYLAKCGGSYSSEWFWSKVWHCFNTDKEVFEAAYSWVEQSDFIPAMLAGIDDVSKLKRNVCAAGHKAMYADAWGGLPSKEFLTSLAPELAELKDRLFDKAYTFQETLGYLSEEWASRLGLPVGIPIAVGALDAHVGAVGAGVGQGSFVKIIGTSTCDIMAFPSESAPGDFPGVAGIVDGSVIPGQIGLEAGQSAVGDLLDWWVSKVLGKDGSYHVTLTEKASQLKAGESGLLSLDWNNGNRNILGDQQLSGLIIGQTLATTDFEIYRALIEATAFGALKIIKLVESQGVEMGEIVVTGGIGHKNELFMQIYADVIGYPVHLVDNPETVAIGAAIMGAATAQPEIAPDELVKKLSVSTSKTYQPNKDEHAVYQNLFEMYSELHDAFGTKEFHNNLFRVMKSLITLRER